LIGGGGRPRLAGLRQKHRGAVRAGLRRGRRRRLRACRRKQDQRA